MLRLLCKNLSQTRIFTGSTTTKSSLNGTHSRFLENPSPKSITHLTNRPKKGDPSPTTVSYLVNSCGLSSESALKASKRFRIISVENADSVLSLLKNHGFDQTKLSQMITRFPVILTMDPNKILKPKMEFFLHRVGFSASDLVELVSTSPWIFYGSLERRLNPSFDFLKGVVGSDENAIITISRMPSFLNFDLPKILSSKVALLRGHGMRESDISMYIMRYPRDLSGSHDRFIEVLSELKKMGFDPLSRSYIQALHTMWGLSSSNWQRKCDIYKSLGWSEDELLKLIKKSPVCMRLSETKIRKGAEFFMMHLGWDLSLISKYPQCLGFSLEKRIIPRYTVMQILLSNGLLKKDVNWGKIFNIIEKDFLNKFVNKYEGEAPKLMEAYTKEVGV
ncbi:hypothetical protein QJS04_geneDACA003569 [Acorus gramineus]|uniref:Mitochondrial transcription termination factor n=1 Tax=Acorus gramineus TaxID=55184 RepID=A0AAV9BPS4_ACOGR|nr:hypothetical protein QJS04_geneDACA003569 [Acorus gramineus]